MSWLEAIVLGLTQGLTEFLPISSSGHLIIVPWLFGWETPGIAFDAALHLGTLLAVLAYFWQDLLADGESGSRPFCASGPRCCERGLPMRTTTPSLLAWDCCSSSARFRVRSLDWHAESKIDDLFHPESNQDRAIVVIAILLAVLRSAALDCRPLWPGESDSSVGALARYDWSSESPRRSP